jgi:hypothetical protein
MDKDKHKNTRRPATGDNDDGGTRRDESLDDEDHLQITCTQLHAAARLMGPSSAKRKTNTLILWTHDGEMHLGGTPVIALGCWLLGPSARLQNRQR